MQAIAQSWLVYRLSHSGFWLGLILFMFQFPAFVLSPVAGVLADRFDRRRILVIAELVSLLQALVLAGLVFTGHVQLWHLAVMSVVLGIVTGFEITTRHAFSVDLVGPSDLPRAIALNSVLINLSRAVGPAAAGLALKLGGEAWCFLLNGLSYVPVLIGLLQMKVERHGERLAGGGVIRNVVEGLQYVRRDRMMVRLLIFSLAVCFVSAPYTVLFPMFARSVLSGGPTTLAWLTGMSGAGSVVGALRVGLVSASRIETEWSVWRGLARSTIAWGVGLCALGWSQVESISALAAFAIGFFMMTLFPVINTAIQKRVPDALRGRVLSLYTMTFLGAMPIGSVLMGWIADRTHPSRVVVGAGVLTLCIGLAVLPRTTTEPTS